jgi:hypothetical protein
MVDQGDAQPKGPCQRKLVNLGCLLPYQINGNYQFHQWKCQNANAEEEDSVQVIVNLHMLGEEV